MMHVLLYYSYVTVPDPDQEKLAHLALCKKLNLKGRILISKDGINGTCCGEKADIDAYQKTMRSHPQFHDIVFKESTSEGQVFPKMKVKVKPELVTLRTPVDITKRAPYITPDQLHKELTEGEDLVLVDMRNDYESAIGRFKNAVCVPMRTFRDLPDLVPFLEPYRDAKIVTYCTGGIRCETATALLRDHNFDNVRQLEGGIVKYCEAYPDGFFEGACYVFDDRMAIRYKGQPDVVLTQCTHCKDPCERYIDCSILSCNDMFLCCESCEQKHHGLCAQSHDKAPLVTKRRSERRTLCAA